MALRRRKMRNPCFERVGELKVIAVHRLETRSSIAELARAFEVNPNVLYRWRCEFHHCVADSWHWASAVKFGIAFAAG